MNQVFNLPAFFWITNALTLLCGMTAWVILWNKSKTTKSDQLCSYIPTLWTSLGIFFTFVSIVYSLWGYTDDAEGFDLAVLISDIIPAFTTSIIGIFFAIFSTLTNRWSLANIEKTDADRFEKIRKEKKIVGESPELILLEIVSAIRNSENATRSLITESITENQVSSKRSKDAITASILTGSEKIEKGVSNTLYEQRETFEDALNRLSDAFSKTLRDFKDNLSSEMKELRDLLKGEIQQIEKQNNGLITTLVKQEGELLDVVKKQLVEESENRNSELKSFISAEDSRMQTYIDTTHDAFGALYTRFEETIAGHVQKETELFQTEIKENIEGFAQAQHQVCTDSILECNARLVANANEVLSSQTEVNKDFITKLQEKLSVTCDNLIAAISSLSEDMRTKIQTIHQQEVELIGTTIENNKQDVKTLIDANRQSIETIAAEIKEDDTDLKQAISVSQVKMREDAVEIQKDFHSTLLNVLNEAQISFAELQKSIADTGRQIASSFDGLEHSIHNSNTEFEAQITALKKQTRESCTILLEDLSNKIDQSARIDKLKETSTEITVSITKCMEDFKSRMSVIVGFLEETTQSVQLSADKYTEAADKSDAINKYIEGTSDLFKLHSNSMRELQISLANMEASVERMREQLIAVINIGWSGNTKANK